MIRKERDGLQWLEFELFSDFPRLVHAVFLRQGGYSQGPFSSLNLGGGSGDDPEIIKKNRQKICQVLGVKELVSGKQCHGKTIHHLMGEEENIGECDGLLTQEKERALMIKHADCQAALFYDPKNHALANIHCGWRGNVQNIYKEAVELMQRKIGSKPQNLLVGISPSLGPQHAEFKNYKTELPEAFWEFQERPTYFNLWEISKKQLLDAGVIASHIEIASLCTFACPEDYFSFRRDQRVTGRHATLAFLYG